MNVDDIGTYSSRVQAQRQLKLSTYDIPRGEGLAPGILMGIVKLTAGQDTGSARISVLAGGS